MHARAELAILSFTVPGTCCVFSKATGVTLGTFALLTPPDTASAPLQTSIWLYEHLVLDAPCCGAALGFRQACS